MFADYSVNDCANGLVKASRITLEKAVGQAEKEFREMLPDGVDIATDALSKMEGNARSNGCRESVIYVRKYNSPGIRLYAKCGYTAFRELDDGVYMKKEI